MRGVMSPPAVQGDATSSMPLLDNGIRHGKPDTGPRAVSDAERHEVFEPLILILLD